MGSRTTRTTLNSSSEELYNWKWKGAIVLPILEDKKLCGRYREATRHYIRKQSVW